MLIEVNKLRSPDSFTGQVVYWFGIVVALVHIYFNTVGTVSELYTSALHFGMFGLLAAFIYPFVPTAIKSSSSVALKKKARVILTIDIVIGLLAAVCAVYLIFAEVALYERGQTFIVSDWIFSLLAVLLAVELTRRTTGWIIPILIIISITYVVWWGRYVEGIFHFPGLSLETQLYRSYFSSDGMFGPIARISSTYVFMFILFGAFLQKSGAGDFIIQLARCLVGKLIGGPGLVAVFGSALMGSISGSAVANTVSTGTITIPLMKRTGFSPRFAAGIEAAASTGGQLMPPVMGAGAFIMSSYTQISYLDIITVAFLPAVLYFLSVVFFVRIEARRLNLIETSSEAQPRFATVMRERGHLLIPLVVLIGLLIYGFTPTYAAGIAILSVIGASWLSPRKMGVRDILDALAMGARQMTTMAVLLVGVGIIVNVVSTTGIGNMFSLMISDWAQGSLLITILLVALASLVLGMGLPVTAAYIVLGTLSAPALFNLIAGEHLINAIAAGQVPDMAKAVFLLVAPEQIAALGNPMSYAQAAALLDKLPPDMLNLVREQVLSPAVLTTALLSAHMIVFWLSQDSNVTPPVCLTAFAAATIAKSPPMRTGLTAWKVAKGLYIVPLLFAYTPFLSNDWLTVLSIFFFGTAGIYALVGALQGYLEGSVFWYWRIVLIGIGVLLLWPQLDLLFRLGGLVVLAVVFVTTRQSATR
ncbi:MAG: TRAP transporter permease [Candidatus Parabeggiatoa sp. nov. 2]|nr:MAG: C4-dicarboxylate ABC transporter permease [Beggiatoa sp. 4572_84]RKZ60797.1 MAG: TRAP transporter permease [Gammaproteobacteria bacterium]HEC83655.1 TRAP transporter fused permease subunit [Thioploca sp.]